MTIFNNLTMDQKMESILIHETDVMKQLYGFLARVGLNPETFDSSTFTAPADPAQQDIPIYEEISRLIEILQNITTVKASISS